MNWHRVGIALCLALFVATSLTGCAFNGARPERPVPPKATQPAPDSTNIPPVSALASASPPAATPAGALGGSETPAPTGAPLAAAAVELAPTWTVAEGSRATFTVGEKLARLPLPNDAVVSTTALSGMLRRDGPSFVEIDLHKLSSDESFRDRYMRDTMFRNTPKATFTIEHAPGAPEGFAEGRPAAGTVAGTLTLGAKQVPLTLTGEGRYEAGAIHLLAKTTFTWAEVGLRAPNLARIVEVQDIVRVEVLIVAIPAA